jgi:hypothetical protein
MYMSKGSLSKETDFSFYEKIAAPFFLSEPAGILTELCSAYYGNSRILTAMKHCRTYSSQ